MPVRPRSNGAPQPPAEPHDPAAERPRQRRRISYAEVSATARVEDTVNSAGGPGLTGRPPAPDQRRPPALPHLRSYSLGGRDPWGNSRASNHGIAPGDPSYHSYLQAAIRLPFEAPPGVTMLETGRVHGAVRPPTIPIPSPVRGSMPSPAFTTLEPQFQPTGPETTLTQAGWAFHAGNITPLNADRFFPFVHTSFPSPQRRHVRSESRNTENVEKKPRRIRAAQTIAHVTAKFALPEDPQPQLTELFNYLTCGRLAVNIFPNGELTALDLYEVMHERASMQMRALSEPELTACLRLAKLDMQRCEEDDVVGRFDSLVSRLATCVHSDDCDPAMMVPVRERSRDTRHGFMYENAFAALLKLGRNDEVSLFGEPAVKLGSLAALAWDRVMATPRARRQSELEYMTWLLDECVEVGGAVVCGNGCMQRIAAILHHVECYDAPDILSLETATSDEQVSFSARRFHDAWKKKNRAPDEGDIQDFFEREVRAFHKEPHGADEFRNFSDRLRDFFDMTYDFAPTEPEKSVSS